MKYYVTFGQSHIHPVTEQLMKDYWVEIDAEGAFEAYSKTNEQFGQNYSMIYSEEGFDDISKSYFTKGKFERQLSVDEMFERKVKGLI